MHFASIQFHHRVSVVLARLGGLPIPNFVDAPKHQALPRIVYRCGACGLLCHSSVAHADHVRASHLALIVEQPALWKPSQPSGKAIRIKCSLDSFATDSFPTLCLRFRFLQHLLPFIGGESFVSISWADWGRFALCFLSAHRKVVFEVVLRAPLYVACGHFRNCRMHGVGRDAVMLQSLQERTLVQASAAIGDLIAAALETSELLQCLHATHMKTVLHSPSIHFPPDVMFAAAACFDVPSILSQGTLEDLSVAVTDRQTDRQTDRERDKKCTLCLVCSQHPKSTSNFVRRSADSPDYFSRYHIPPANQPADTN